MPKDYLRSIELLIAIVVGCIRWSELAQQLRDAKFAVILLISSKGTSIMTKLKLLSIAALLSRQSRRRCWRNRRRKNRERQRSTKASVSGRITTRPRMRLLTPAISIEAISGIGFALRDIKEDVGSLFEPFYMPSFSLRSLLTELPSVIDVAY